MTMVADKRVRLGKQAVEQYLSAFRAATQQGFVEWTLPVRTAAITRFAELGFPTTKHEAWKYTNVAPLVAPDYQCAREPAPSAITQAALSPFLFGAPRWYRAVFVNGFLIKALSHLPQEKAGVELVSVQDAQSLEPELLKQHFHRYAQYTDDAFLALNTAFFQDGTLLCLAKGAVLPEPIHLIYISTAQETACLVYPRNLLLASEGSQATIIESYVSLGAGTTCTNAVTEIILEQGAVIDHCKLELEHEHAFHVAHTTAHVQRDAQFSSAFIALGSQLTRNALRVVLEAEGSSCTLNGLYLLRHAQHVDNHTLIEHTKPQGTSRQFYKGVLDDAAHGVFNGRIFVHQDAQETNAEQSNKNILLSDQATVDTQPQLEILADDVKCAHGAAVGQLDDNAIFYLRSRGMSEKRARSLLTYGFARDIIERVNIPVVRESLDKLVWSRIESRSGKGARA